MKLNQQCKSSIRRGNTKGTRANHRTHYSSYVGFCNEFEYEPFPADNWRYCQYAQYLKTQHKKPGTVNNYVSTIRVLHQLQGYAVPPPGQIHYKMLMEFLKKDRKDPVKQATPMDHGNLFRLFEHVDLNSELEAVGWTAVLMGYSMMLRVSNLGPMTRAKFDIDQNFTRADLQLRQGHWSLGVRWSKTMQHKNKTNWAPLLPSQHKCINTKHWVLRMVKLIPAQQNEPLFLVQQGDNRYPLTSPQVTRLLKKWCEPAGLDVKAFTGHCLRRGGINWGHQAQLTNESLKILGGWGSQAYLGYLDLDFESRICSGQKMLNIEQDIIKKYD